MLRDVAVLSLMEQLKTEKEGCWAGSGNGAFALPGKSRSVVVTAVKCVGWDVEVVHQDVMMHLSGS